MIKSLGAGSSGGVTQLVAGTNITLTPSGGTGAVTISASGGGGGGASATEVTVDFGSSPTSDALFTISDASVSAASKIIISESGKAASGRASGDAQWDAIACAANPGTGTFDVYCKASPGPVVGPRVLHYMVL